jgi:hypothetical protein
MTLFASSASGSSNGWLAAAKRLRAEGWPVSAVEVLLAPPAGASAAETTQSSSSSSGGADHLSVLDSGGGWQQLHRGAATAAVLVRPDGHVAWRQLEPEGGSEGGSGACSERLLRVLKAMGWRRQQHPQPS